MQIFFSNSCFIWCQISKWIHSYVSEILVVFSQRMVFLYYSSYTKKSICLTEYTRTELSDRLSIGHGPHEADQLLWCWWSLKEIICLLSKSQGRSCTSQSLIKSAWLCLALVCLGTVEWPIKQPRLEVSGMRRMAMIWSVCKHMSVVSTKAAAAALDLWFATLSESQNSMMEEGCQACKARLCS